MWAKVATQGLGEFHTCEMFSNLLFAPDTHPEMQKGIANTFQDSINMHLSGYAAEASKIENWREDTRYQLEDDFEYLDFMDFEITPDVLTSIRSGESVTDLVKCLYIYLSLIHI